ncbi:hypothetical protein ACKXGF_04945 [Alkalibacillus sp. S2W]|uniref:hypothetical protein n=1 Tax=Alkalibacillus sp. S2W TaxID=3386553 RepID=UPI00398D04BE
MSEGQNIITCNKCGSNKVDRLPLALTFLVIGACIVWIPVLGWFLAPILFLIALIIPIMFYKKVFMKCKDCKHIFDVKKDVYKEYKEFLQDS